MLLLNESPPKMVVKKSRPTEALPDAVLIATGIKVNKPWSLPSRAPQSK